MTVKIKPGLYITSKTLRLIDEITYNLFRQRIRERGYRVSNCYGPYKPDNIIEETYTIHLDDGDLLWSTIMNSRKREGAYEITFQEIMQLVNHATIAEACDVSNIDILTIEELAKHIQQMMDESNKLNETLSKFKQALIKKLS